ILRISCLLIEPDPSGNPGLHGHTLLLEQTLPGPAAAAARSQHTPSSPTLRLHSHTATEKSLEQLVGSTRRPFPPPVSGPLLQCQCCLRPFEDSQAQP